MEHTHLLGTHGHWFWILPMLFMIGMFLLGAFMCRRMRAWRSRPAFAGRGRVACCGPTKDSRSDHWYDTPGQILDRRFAKGEITSEQREEMKRELESGPTPVEEGAG